MSEDQFRADETEPHLRLLHGEQGATALYIPARKDLVQAWGQARGSGPLPEIPLAHFDTFRSRIVIYPLRTRPTALTYLGAKHPLLGGIIVETPGLEAPRDQDDAEEALFALPEGFLHDWRAGLGLHKIYHPILHAVEKMKPSHRLVIARSRPTAIEPGRYVLNRQDYDRLRAELQRIARVHQEDGRKERRVAAHNALLADRAPGFYRQDMPFRRDALREVLDRSPARANLQADDERALLRAVSRRAGRLAERDTAALTRLRGEIERASLAVLIQRVRSLIGRKAREQEWQRLLEDNPFLLTMLFGAPMVLIAGQFTIASGRLDGRDARIGDFLLAHELTRNALLLEIKRADMPLVSRSRAQRGGDWGVDPQLTAAIVQTLDQKQRFLERYILSRNDNPQADFEAHHVACVVLAGQMPGDDGAKRALEMYRRAFKDVEVLTFTELLQRLEALNAYLDPEGDFAIEEGETSELHQPLSMDDDDEGEEDGDADDLGPRHGDLF